jgi:20S proteasome alpha/beta subunit
VTIAVCYISPEGVVLGADSTTTYAPHIHFNNSQKLFEIGENRRLAS